MTYRTLLLGLMAASLSSSALAADVGTKPTHVVELFTSQGCSSCPPANRFATKMSDEAGMLVLSYGVTYWDYLGWKDTFGDPAFTRRQRDYRDAFEASNIYTPQLVLGGAAHSPRYSKKDVVEMGLSGPGLGLRAKRTGDRLCFTHDADKPVNLDLVTYKPGTQSVDVERGENGGRTLELTNVVTEVQTFDQDRETCVAYETGKAYAALVHDRTSAKILDALVVAK